MVGPPRHPLSSRAKVMGFVMAASLAGCSPESRVRSTHEALEEARSPQLLLERGRAFASVGDNTRAVQYLAAALESGAEERPTLSELIQVMVAARRYRDAIERGESYLQRWPGDTRVRFLIGSLYAAIAEHEKAMEHLERVLQSDAHHQLAHYFAGVILRDQRRDWVGADYHFRKYLEIEPDGVHAAEARASLLESVP